MDLPVLELGRTSFIGAYLILGVMILRRSFWLEAQWAKPLPWSFGLLFIIGAYGLGVLVESVAESKLERFAPFSDERVRVRELFEADGSSTPLARELDRHFCAFGQRVHDSYAGEVIPPFHELFGRPDLARNLAVARARIDPIYFMARSRVLQESSYFTELTEIDARSDFSRSLSIVALLLLPLAVPVAILHWRRPSASSGGWWRWVETRSMRMAATFVVPFLLIVSGNVAFRAEEGELASRVFGYYLSLEAFPATPATATQGPACGREVVREASGVAVHEGRLLIVGDEAPGRVFELPVPASLMSRTGNPPTAFTSIIRADMRLFSSEMALDLEGLAVLPDSTLIAASERFAVLVSNDGVLVEYPDEMSEVAGRGIEGLAVREDGTVAALWEGGFVRPGPFSGQAPSVRMPLVCIHPLPSEPDEACSAGEELVRLQVPAAPDASQVFRAPDLVWGRDTTLVVLLSSTNAADDSFAFKWLQRFSLRGAPVGEPLNLCAPGVLPPGLRGGSVGNFEALAWLNPTTVVLVSDHPYGTYAFAIRIDPWPSTEPGVRC